MDLVRTAYMRRFKCSGSRCPDTCCKNWSINIDRETYEKYVVLEDPEFKERIGTYVAPLPEESSDEAVFGVIGLKKDRYCPFLSSERTCAMQNRHGPDYLSNACVMYPRVINYVNGRVEQCGDVSCPIMAELALGNSGGIDFVEDDVDVERGERNLFFSVIDFDEAGFSEEMVDFVSDLRTRSFEIILDHEYSMEGRLTLLGMLYSDLQEKLAERNVGELRAIMEADRTLPEDGDDDVGGQLKMLQTLVRAFRGDEGCRYIEYERCYARVLAGIGGEDGGFDAERYRAAYNEYYEPFIGVLGYLLENYVLNDMFRCLMPLQGVVSGNIMVDYYKMLLRYALIRVHLVGVAGADGGLTKKSIVNAIHLIVRSLETNRVYVERVDELIGEKGHENAFFSLILLTP
jgi:lysine-N-methylase